MQGKVIPISLARSLVIDFTRATVPLTVVKRTMRLERLVKARAARAVRPGWAAMFAKAFSIVALDEPCLRTLYLKWPWPRLYEARWSVGMVAVVREAFDKEVPLLAKIHTPDELPLAEVNDRIQRVKRGPTDDLPHIQTTLWVGGMPLLLRLLLCTIGLNYGPLRGENFGTFIVSSIATFGAEHVVAQAPGPNLVTYGLLGANHTIEVLLHFDHRVYDGIVSARALRRLEEVLNGAIADELLMHDSDMAAG